MLRWFDCLSTKALNCIRRTWLHDTDSRWRGLVFVKASFRSTVEVLLYSDVFFTKDINKEHEVHLSGVHCKELHRWCSIDLGVPCQFCDFQYARTVHRVLGEMWGDRLHRSNHLSIVCISVASDVLFMMMDQVFVVIPKIYGRVKYISGLWTCLQVSFRSTNLQNWNLAPWTC